MRACLTAIATLASLGVVLANVPLPPADKLQPGHFPAWVCQAWEMAGVGDTCQGIAERNRLSVERFIEMNPQIGSLQDCSTKLLSSYFYCISTSPQLVPGAGTGVSTGQAPVDRERGPAASRRPLPPPPPANTQPVATPVRSVEPPPPTKAPELGCRFQSDNGCWKAWAVAGPNYSSRFTTFCANVLAAPRTWSRWEDVEALGYPGYKYMDFDCGFKYRENPKALTTLCECLNRGSVTLPAGNRFNGYWCGQYSRCRPD